MDSVPVKFSIQTRSRSRQEVSEGDIDSRQPTPESEPFGEFGQIVELRTPSSSSSDGSEGEPHDSEGPEVVQQEGQVEMAEARGPLITPHKFRGGCDDNVEDYLAHFERIARANGWDEAKKLVIIPCYLEGAALKWYENVEARLGNAITWDQVKTGLKETFQTIAWDEQLEFRLRMRMQRENEPVEAYVQDVLNLCSRVDNNMPERTKIKHVLRGLNPSLLEKVMLMSNDNLESLMTNIKKVQTARFMAGQRVDQLMTDPLESRPMKEPLPSNIAPHTVTSSLESKIENLTSEFAKIAMHLMSSKEPKPREDAKFDHNRGRGQHRGMNRGRTSDGRVICYKCNRIGHYAVNCRVNRGQGQGNGEGGR